MGKNKKAPGLRRRSGFTEFGRLFRSMADPYRPELHYMRGPGPKWRAKHATPPADAPVVVEGLARIKG